MTESSEVKVEYLKVEGVAIVPLSMHVDESTMLRRYPTGYGSNIPTRHVVFDGKWWRRVYLCIHSNVGTTFVKKDATSFVVRRYDLDRISHRQAVKLTRSIRHEMLSEADLEEFPEFKKGAKSVIVSVPDIVSLSTRESVLDWFHRNISLKEMGNFTTSVCLVPINKDTNEA